jgi:hypothetical protein
MPRRILAPILEIGIAALWQVVSPCCFECCSRRFKGRRGAVPIVARIAARIEAAAPLPLIRRRRGAGPLDDDADADAGIVDMPGHGPIVDALAGEGGHGPLKRGQGRQANRPTDCGRAYPSHCRLRVRKSCDAVRFGQ